MKETLKNIVLGFIVIGIISAIGIFIYRNRNESVMTNEDYKKIDTIIMKISDTITITKEKIKIIESNIKTKDQIQNNEEYNIQMDTNNYNSVIRNFYDTLFSNSEDK